MADRIVYLVTKQTKVTKASDLEYVDDAQLNKLLADGYSIQSTTPRKMGKLDVTMLVLKPAADERGLSAPMQQDDPMHPRWGREETGRDRGISVPDEFGGSRQVSIGQAFVQSLDKITRGLSTLGQHGGHLGAPGNHNMPGLSIISGYDIGRAWDLGLMAQHAGQERQRNPFPAGSIPHTKWLEGWHAGDASAGGSSEDIHPVAIKECYEHGKSLARRLGPTDEVNCPYQGQKRLAWMRGFSDGGGRIE